MVLKADQERVKTLLKDTITLLCKNGLSFKSKFNVQALIGVTLDDSDVFLVDINEIVKSEKSPPDDAHSESSDEEYEKSRKRSNRDGKGRRSKSPDNRQRKRAKVSGHVQPVKKEMPSSEEEEEPDEDEEEMMAMRHGIPRDIHRGMMPKPGHMWDDEEDDEEDPDSMSGSFDDSNSQFPPEVLHNRIQQQHLQHVRLQQQQNEHSKQLHQHHHSGQQHFMKPESTQGPRKGMNDDDTGDIVYIKEEPEDWPPPGEVESPEDGNIHPDSMYQSLVNPAAADTSGLPEDHNFSSLSGLDLPSVGSQDGSAMWNQPTQSAPRPYRPRTSRTATVTSDAVNQQQSQSAGNLSQNPDTQQRRRFKNAERQRRYRERMRKDPALRALMLERGRQRNYKRRAEGKKKLIDEMSDEEKERMRQYWRQGKRRNRARKDSNEVKVKVKCEVQGEM